MAATLAAAAAASSSSDSVPEIPISVLPSPDENQTSSFGIIPGRELAHAASAGTTEKSTTLTCSCWNNICKAIYWVVVCCFITCVSIAVLPLLLICLLIVRLLQLIQRGDAYVEVCRRNCFFLFGINLYGLLILFVPIFITPSLLSPIFGFFISILGSLYLPKLHNEKGLNVEQAVSEISIVVFFLLLTNGYGGNWELIVFLIGQNLITLSTHMTVYLLRISCQKINRKANWYMHCEKFLHLKYLVYCANGMKRSANFIFNSVLLLLIWVFLSGIRTDARESCQANTICFFGTWTCVCLLICSLLWLMKNSVLLLWEARVVYDRLTSEILEARKQLYFLGIFCRHKEDIFNLQYKPKRLVLDLVFGNRQDKADNIFICKRDQFLLYLDLQRIDTNIREDKVDVWGIRNERQVGKVMFSSRRRIRVKKGLLMQKEHLESEPEDWTPDLIDIHQVAQYFLSSKDALSKDKFVSDFLNDLKSNISRCDYSAEESKLLKRVINGESKDENSRMSPIEEHDWDYFTRKLDSSVTISFEELEKQMKDAYKRCSILANTLSSSKEVVDCLNKIFSAIIIGATLILWLFLTGLATTKIVVLIASPLLALTFMFGDTCKTLFQGIIFVYVVHPFHVGDTCEIEGLENKQLSVKAVGVWKTTFSEADSQKEIIFPNSVLATKMIINHKVELNWLDNKTENDGASSGTRVQNGEAAAT